VGALCWETGTDESALGAGGLKGMAGRGRETSTSIGMSATVTGLSFSSLSPRASP